MVYFINSLPFLKRKKITINNNSGSAQTAYQVLVTVTYAAAMQVDFDDIRFAYPNNELIDFWLESKTDSVTANFWVEVGLPNYGVTPTGDNYIYMYYGNPTAASASNGTNTFPFFDDFGGDTSKWTISGTGSIVNGQLKLTANTLATGNIAFDSGILEGYYSGNAVTNYYFHAIYFYKDGTHYVGARGIYANGYATQYEYDLGAGGTAGNGGTNSQSGYIKIERTGSNTTLYQKTNYGDAWTLVKASFSDTMTALYAGFCTYQPGYIAYFDNVHVRKYASPEPAVTTTGQEEHSRKGGIIIY